MKLIEHKKWIFRLSLVLSILLGLAGGVINVMRTLMIQILMDGTGDVQLIRKLWQIEEGLLENPVSFLIGFVLCFGFTWLIYFAAFWIVNSFATKEGNGQPIDSDSTD